MAFVLVGCQKNGDDSASGDSFRGTISISGAWALYPMVVKWAQEFQAIHPEVKIDIAAGGAGKGMADALAGAVDLGMVSREIFPAELEKGAYAFAVTKDAVLPTVNKSNPLIEKILMKGVSREIFTAIWISGQVKNWSDVVGGSGDYPISVYTRSDACGAAQTWAAYLGGHQEDIIGTGVYGDPGLADAVRKDILGIGYNNVNYAYDAQTKKEIAPLKVLPIDLNTNGQLDPEEKFYDTLSEMTRAIADGRYPSPPARLLYLVSRGVPERPVVREFIRWILTDGQQYIEETGYIQLKDEQIQQEQRKLAKE
jgi:phosphate transport system substrate-binding protein